MIRRQSPAVLLVLFAWCLLPARAGEDDAKSCLSVPVENFPQTWIGVRLSEMPDALKAHVQRGRFMLINIVESGPADQSGLDRYDVVLSFNGQPIEELGDLIDAIQQNGPDKPATMVVIHQGQEQTVTVTPLKRNPGDKLAYKYEEGELVQADPMEKYFGHRLKIGPDGKFIFEPQGRLDMLPDDVKELLEKMQQFNWQDRDLIDPDASDGTFQFSPDGDFPEDASVSITIVEDDKTLTISRAPEGTITVTRKEPNGDSKTVEYENEEQFQKEDPDAYRVYRRSFKVHDFSALIQTPDLNSLGVHQYTFQKDLQAEMQRVQDQVQKALEEARKMQEEAEKMKSEKK